MYFSSYNPTIHDLYLYGSGNTGYPIGLNPNCILYEAKESYKWMNTVYRDFTNQGGPSPPPGLTAAYKPNYYNQTAAARSYWVGPNFLMSSSHEFFERPCIPQPGSGEEDAYFETGLTFNSLASEFTFWKSNFNVDGFQQYQNIDFIYELVKTPIAIGNTYIFNPSTCPGGVTGISAGTTFYRVTSRRDSGIFKIHGATATQTRLGPYMRTISPYSMLTNFQKQNIKNYLSRASNSLYSPFYKLILLDIPNSELYVMGANQQVASLNKITISIAAFFNDNPALLFPNGSGLGIDISPPIQTWGGDSSSLICFKKNNELFGIGLNSGPQWPGRYSMLNNERYPSMEYILKCTDIPITYYYSNTSEKTIATKPQFNLLNSKLSSLKQKFLDIKTNLIG